MAHSVNEIVRHFPENGLKMLLQHPAHVRDLLTLARAQLDEGGALGRVLELIRRRFASEETFREALVRAVAYAETLSENEWGRWRDLLSYLLALVYHDRGKAEREALRETVEHAVRADNRKREVQIMGQTIAEALREEGIKEGILRSRQETVLRLLNLRFHKVPRKVQRIVQTCQDVHQLDTWIDRTVTAATLDDVGLITAE